MRVRRYCQERERGSYQNTGQARAHHSEVSGFEQLICAYQNVWRGKEKGLR